MKINEVAKLTGITVRTLHYYDEIGLLAPSETTEAGYRIYNETALAALQQILFFRELDFSLNEIKEIMTNPKYNQEEALVKHKKLLIRKRNRLDGLITLVENTIKGEQIMSFKEFDMSEIEAGKNEYAAEVKKRWGETTAYKESEKRTSQYDKKQWDILNDESAAILREFGEKRNIRPDSEPAQKLVQRWQSYITDNFYECTREILAGLGLMYIGDERFTRSIDRNGAGTAAFMAAAIEIYTGSGSTGNELIEHLDKLHTTELGAVRIRKNLSIETDDVVGWCRTKIKDPAARITREGKNWYIEIENSRITVNAYSYTIITAHKVKK